MDYDYKNDIIATRTGCIGSSDARMLMQIGAIGQVPRSSYERLAVVKGLKEKVDTLHTSAVNYGNEIEMEIFSYLSSGDPRYESNPRWESERYSRKNVKCIAHPDIVLEDEESKTISVYEVKTSRYPTEYVKREYKAQLFFQCMLARERAAKRGKMWKVRMYLVHYDTSGLDLDVCNEFDPARISVNKVLCHANTFDLSRSMDIVDDFLSSMSASPVVADIVEADYLPSRVKSQFDSVAAMLREIKEREAKVEEFKKRLYDFLVERGISKVRCDDFAFTVVHPSQQVTFDAKRWWEDWASENEEESISIRDKYKKVTSKKGYVKITVKDAE